jgi:hypothetical protein
LEWNNWTEVNDINTARNSVGGVEHNIWIIFGGDPASVTGKQNLGMELLGLKYRFKYSKNS